LEWSDQLFTHTMYYRNGNSFYQVSIFYDGWEEPAQLIQALTFNPSFSTSGAPAVNGNFPYEPGRHWVLGRAGTTLYFSEIVASDEDLIP
jgi:hypothetical protein